MLLIMKIFFLIVGPTNYFESKIRSFDTKRKFTWRYRWPLKVKNEVISRLIQLNQDLSKLEIRSNNFEHKKVSKSKSDSIGQYQIGLEF